VADSDLDWPSEPWELTAPESYALLYGLELTGSRPFRFALLELVVRGVFGLVPVKENLRLRPDRETMALVDRGAAVASLPRPLASVWELYENARTRALREAARAVPIGDLVASVVSRYRTYYAWGVEEVAPALIDQGLCTTKRERRFPWISSYMRLIPTAAGQEAIAALQTWIAIGEAQLGVLTHEHPQRALEFANRAGSAMLLMESLYPEMQQLSRYVREPLPTPEAALYGVPAGFHEAGGNTQGEDDKTDTPEIDVSGVLDLGALAGALDFGVLDAFGGIVDAIDFALGGDGGGGDGGGDGGGS
jgi:hypothetical protein